MTCDETSFNKMVTHYYSTLLVRANSVTGDRQTAEDIVQEAFLKLWKKRAELDDDNIGGWLYRVVAHASYKYLKRKAKRSEALHFLKWQKQKDHSGVEDYLIHKESMQIFYDAYSRLPEKQKEVYRLRHKEGLSRDEIAGQLNISSFTVKNHLAKACQFIKGHFVCIALLSCLFIFENLFFSRNSPKYRSGDLYNIHLNSSKVIIK